MVYWALIFVTVVIWSYVGAKDVFTWWLEALPALVGAGVLLFTRKSFPLTPLLYWWILAHCLVLLVGAHYTYAEVPLFDWIRDTFDQSRNNYDKVGHFMQGFVPALIANEILIRKQVINGQIWLGFFVVCFALAFSAFYELIEWLAAEMSGEAAEAFLGTQGYIWDTQSDMALALIGAILAIVFLGKVQRRQIANCLAVQTGLEKESVNARC